LPTLLDESKQRASFAKFCYDAVDIFEDVGLVYFDDVGMVDFSEDVDLVHKLEMSLLRDT
jgi:hypothetical protein